MNRVLLTVGDPARIHWPSTVLHRALCTITAVRWSHRDPSCDTLTIRLHKTGDTLSVVGRDKLVHLSRVDEFVTVSDVHGRAWQPQPFWTAYAEGRLRNSQGL